MREHLVPERTGDGVCVEPLDVEVVFFVLENRIVGNFNRVHALGV